MASIKITYVAPVQPAEHEVAQICAVFVPTNAYTDTAAYDGTIWDTNVQGFGVWEGFEDFVKKLSMAPTALILFREAAVEGEVTFEESDAKQIAYYKDLGRKLAPYGFTVTEVVAETPAEG